MRTLGRGQACSEDAQSAAIGCALDALVAFKERATGHRCIAEAYFVKTSNPTCLVPVYFSKSKDHLEHEDLKRRGWRERDSGWERPVHGITTTGKSRSIWAECYGSGKPKITDNADSYGNKSKNGRAISFGSIMAVPGHHGQESSGTFVLSLDCKEPGAFSDIDIPFARSIINVIELCLDTIHSNYPKGAGYGKDSGPDPAPSQSTAA